MLPKQLRITLSFLALPIVFLFVSSCTSLSPKIDKSSKNIDPKKLVPETNEILTWARDEDMVYCEDLVCLASLIDGAAPYYIDGGAEKIIFQDFVKSPENKRISLEIYQTKNNSQAQSLYKGASSISPVEIEGLGISGRIDQGLIGSYRVETYKNNYFIRIVSLEKSDSAKEDILSFAKNISSKIP